MITANITVSDGTAEHTFVKVQNSGTTSRWVANSNDSTRKRELFLQITRRRVSVRNPKLFGKQAYWRFTDTQYNALGDDVTTTSYGAFVLPEDSTITNTEDRKSTRLNSSHITILY